MVRIPILLYVILVIFLFCVGAWQSALALIACFCIQFAGKYFFDLDGRESLFTAALIIVVIYGLIYLIQKI